MIERIDFENFRVLRSTTLPLGAFTLIVGPNGSGKSTALQAIHTVANRGNFAFESVATAGTESDVNVSVWWGPPDNGFRTIVTWFKDKDAGVALRQFDATNNVIQGAEVSRPFRILQQARVFSLDPVRIAGAVTLTPKAQLDPAGDGLASVLDRLRDKSHERFEALNQEMHRWFWEYDRILFDVPGNGLRSIMLRTVTGRQIAARDLSQGTLLALAILTLAYVPDPPPLVAFEEPDRGIHPRLLREVQDALYRLAYPQNYGEERPPVQVIATTHSPYFLDLFKDHPEEIVIAQKHGGDATFERLSDRPDIDQILEGASLGEVWYSGILGGVPVEP